MGKLGMQGQQGPTNKGSRGPLCCSRMAFSLPEVWRQHMISRPNSRHNAARCNKIGQTLHAGPQLGQKDRRGICLLSINAAEGLRRSCGREERKREGEGLRVADQEVRLLMFHRHKERTKEGMKKEGVGAPKPPESVHSSINNHPISH